MYTFRIVIFILNFHALCALTILHVSTNTDNDPGRFGEPGDLRFCLNTMNYNLNTTPDDHAIVFDFPMTIQLNGILPIINNSINNFNITIGNSGSIPTVTIDGGSIYPGFFIPMGNVTIQNILFQNMLAQGGTGGNGISGGGGGMGAGGALYIPQTFLNGSTPSVTLTNVSINNCSAVGGNGGNYTAGTGNEGGGGGGGLMGNGGSIITTGSTGGGGGGGFGGNGGDATVSTDSDPTTGGGGGGGGGIGSRASTGTLENLGNGGSDQEAGSPGNAYGLTVTAGSGGGGHLGGENAGGGGGGGSSDGISQSGGGGGGSSGSNGMQPQGSIPPGGSAAPSGGNGSDGGGGGGGAIVLTSFNNNIDGKAGTGGYGGGGGGGAGAGASDLHYAVQGGSGGLGAGGGGGGVNIKGDTSANGGDSLGGGGGGGGGSSYNVVASGGSDIGNLGGGSGGSGSDTVGIGSGGGGGGGGSGLGAAIFVDSGLVLVIKALSGTATIFNTSNNTVAPGIGGSGYSSGADGSALGTSIFLRTGSSVTFLAEDSNDLLVLGDGVQFDDDTTFGAGGTNVVITGNGTVIYNGTTNYQGTIKVNNATFQVNGTINNADISVCRSGLDKQRGTLSGIGTLHGNVFVNSGTIFPDAESTLTLGSLTLSPASINALGSLMRITINTNGSSLVSVNNSATLAGILQIDLDANVQPGTFVIVTSNGITGTFDSVQFTGTTPKKYSLSYLPADSPTYVQFEIIDSPTPPVPPTPPVIIKPPTHFKGVQKINNFGFEYELYTILTWDLSTSSRVSGYYLYRNNIRIATVSASTHAYIDHNQPCGSSSTYTLVAFDAHGHKSSSVSIVVQSA